MDVSFFFRTSQGAHHLQLPGHRSGEALLAAHVPRRAYNVYRLCLEENVLEILFSGGNRCETTELKKHSREFGLRWVSQTTEHPTPNTQR